MLGPVSWCSDKKLHLKPQVSHHINKNSVESVHLFYLCCVHEAPVLIQFVWFEAEQHEAEAKSVTSLEKL